MANFSNVELLPVHAPAEIEPFGRVTPWARIPKTRSAEPRASLQEDHSWRPNVGRGPYMGHGVGHGAMVHPRCYTQLQGTSLQLKRREIVIIYPEQYGYGLWVNTFIVQFFGA